MQGGTRTSSSGHPGARGLTATQLRSMWRSASQERGWSHPDDWWSPAVDAVAESLVTDGDVSERCRRLGLARCRAGVSIAETLDDVLAVARLARALYAHPAYAPVLPHRKIDVVDLLKSVAVGWAEGAEGGVGLRDLPEPTSSRTRDLPGADYLIERLREVSAEAEFSGETLGDRYGLVVSTLSGPAGGGSGLADLQERVAAWDRTWQLAQLTDDLRSVFSAGESIARIGPGAVVVLARRTPQFTATVASLRALINERDQRPAPRVWVERLPNNLHQAVQLLTDLRR